MQQTIEAARTLAYRCPKGHRFYSHGLAIARPGMGIELTPTECPCPRRDERGHVCGESGRLVNR